MAQPESSRSSDDWSAWTPRRARPDPPTTAMDRNDIPAGLQENGENPLPGRASLSADGGYPVAMPRIMSGSVL